MLKMILDQMGSVHLTSSGVTILREITATHPASKTLIEVSRSQQEEVGDGTTSVIVLISELLQNCKEFFEQNIHPQKIVKAFYQALDDVIPILEKKSFKVDISNDNEVKKIIKSCIGTKITHRFSDLITGLALDSVKKIVNENVKEDIDIKRYIRIEKIPGGELNKSEVLNGIMLEKDILHPKMRRRIENPRILLLDCNLEYKKGESQLNVQMGKEEDFEKLLQMEDDFVKQICEDIIKFKPDLVITEKGVSDLAQFYFVSNNISCIRRIRKTDNNRISRAVGATIVNKTSEIKESDIGTGCGLFEINKIGDDYFTYLTQCKNPKACTVILRGPSKDVLNEIERNLQDAMYVVKNIYQDPRIVYGGGCIEMALASELIKKSKTIKGVEQLPYQMVAKSLEIIPKILAQNAGARVIKIITDLRAKHSEDENSTYGIDGIKGEIAKMSDLGIVEPLRVKSQTIKTSIESCCLLLRIDDIVSGIKKKKS